MCLYILLLRPVSFGASRLNNFSDLDLLFNVAFPFSLSLLWVPLQLANEFLNFVSRLFILQKVCNHLWSQQHRCEACTISSCVQSSEGGFPFCQEHTLLSATDVHPHNCPWRGLSRFCVLVVFLRGKACPCLSCSTPCDVSNWVPKFTLGCKAGPFHCECAVCTPGSVETLTSASIQAAPLTAFPDGSLGLLCVLDKCSASSFLTSITSTHWGLHLDLISPGYL